MSRLKDDKRTSGVSVLHRSSKDKGKYKDRGGRRDQRVCKDAREFIRSKSSQERKYGWSGRGSGRSEKEKYDKVCLNWVVNRLCCALVDHTFLTRYVQCTNVLQNKVI